jgi:small GTP-binding protein
MSDRSTLATRVKVITVGNASVGKTCLVITYMKGVFPDNIDSTIGAAQNTRKLTMDDRLIDFHIWDTAGSERYRSLLPMYSRGAHVALVCFDNPDLKNIEEHITTVKKDNPDIHIILVATKMDSDFEYEYDDILDYANKNGYDTMYTSALKNKKVTETFELAAKRGLVLADRYPVKQLTEPKVTLDATPTRTVYGTCCGSQS